MRAATRLAWILAAGSAALCGCAKVGPSISLASLTGSPAAPAASDAPPTPPAGAANAARPQMLPPVNAIASASPPHEAAKPPSWGLFDVLTPYRGQNNPDEEAPVASEFATGAGIPISPAAVPTKEELLAKLKDRKDVDAAELARWEKIVQSTPADDWPLVAIQLQAVLNYKSFQAMQSQGSGGRHQGSEAIGREPQNSPTAATSLPTNPEPSKTPPPQEEAKAQPTTSPAPAAPAPTVSAPAAAAPTAAAPPASSAAASPDGAKPEVLPPASSEKPPQPIAATAPVAGTAPVAAGDAPPPVQSWREQLARAIEALEAELESTVPESPAQVIAGAAAAEEDHRTQAQRQRERARKEAHLRLLYVAAERSADAARGVEEFPAAEQEFWKHQLHGLGVFLDDEEAPVADRRARLTLRELQEGMHHLAAASGLDVRNLAFCPQVFSFGNYIEFAPYEFRANQEVLLYAEIDNFAAETRPDGFETELQGSYQIFDGAGRRVDEHVFPPEKELCRSRRRDFFVPFRVYMPKRIDPGGYSLQLTVEDLKGRKFGQASVRFSIVP